MARKSSRSSEPVDKSTTLDDVVGELETLLSMIPAFLPVEGHEYAGPPLSDWEGASSVDEVVAELLKRAGELSGDLGEGRGALTSRVQNALSLLRRALEQMDDRFRADDERWLEAEAEKEAEAERALEAGAESVRIRHSPRPVRWIRVDEWTWLQASQRFLSSELAVTVGGSKTEIVGTTPPAPPTPSASSSGGASPSPPAPGAMSASTDAPESPRPGHLGLIVDLDRYSVSREGLSTVADLSKSRLSWGLLLKLYANGWSFTTRPILKEVWKRYGVAVSPSNEAMDSALTALRKLLGPLRIRIANSRDGGWRLEDATERRGRRAD